MRKNKIAVLSLMLAFILIFIFVAVYFLLLRGNDAAPGRAAQEAAVLELSGLAAQAANDPQAAASLFARRVVVRRVVLDSGELLAAGRDKVPPAHCVNLAPERDPAQIRQRCAGADIYLIRDEQGEIQQVILPVFGRGAKSMLYGLLALARDGRTVTGLLYYQQHETPLLGARVTDPEWLSQWPGKKAFNERGKPALKVAQTRRVPADEYTVDGISGATLTSRGVEKSLHYWLGDEGFGPFLHRLRQTAEILN